MVNVSNKQHKIRNRTLIAIDTRAKELDEVLEYQDNACTHCYCNTREDEILLLIMAH